MEHDLDYDAAENKSDEHIADRKMLDRLKATPTKGVREKKDKKDTSRCDRN